MSVYGTIQKLPQYCGYDVKPYFMEHACIGYGRTFGTWLSSDLFMRLLSASPM